MSYTFIHLGETYNEALLALADLSSPGDKDFRISRRPDFFALSSELGDFHYYGIIKDDVLVAAIGVTEQTRLISGMEKNVLYFHDLKVHPTLGGAHAYYRLIDGVTKIYNGQAGKKVMFSVILESNANLRAITKGRGLFSNAEWAGKIVHVGFPLFSGSLKQGKNVMIISGEDAWDFYCSQHIDFSLVDKKIFLRPNGFFLGVEENGRMASVCKIMDQIASRKIMAARSISVPERLINFYCSLRGYQELPDTGGIFRHACLSYFSSRGSTDYRGAFISYLRRHYKNQYSYIFTGMLEEEANKHLGFLVIKFKSNIYCYGNGPAIKFSFPELTLI
jgi:hypothetical protein